MTITFLDLYNEVAGQPWSMFDADAESMDDLESSLRISINKATSYLWNLYPWSFRKNISKIRTKAGKAEYDLPIGLLQRKTIDGSQRYGIKYNNKFLSYRDDYEVLDNIEETSGEPTDFYIDGDKLYIYPTPDDTYTISISYLSATYSQSEDEEDKFSFTEDSDILNIPEKYEEIFKNCVISLSMLYAIADETDENYSGYQRQYDDALQILMKYCKDSIVDKYIVW